MATKKERVVVEIVADAKGFQRSLDRANKSLKSVEKSSRSTAKSLDFFRAATGITTLAISVQRLGSAFVTTNIAVQQTEKAFKAVFGEGQGARELEYVKDVANEMGAEFLSLTKSYASLSAASKDTILEGDDTRAIFEAVTRAMGKLGKSAADTEGALKAIEQMMNKGTITAEEWKGQLGERLPGSMAILAKALGKTTSEIMDMMEAGEILATDTLPRVTEEINRLYNDGERVEGLVQSWNRFTNAVVELTTEMDEASGATTAMADALDVATGLLSSAPVDSYSGALERLSKWAATSAVKLNEMLTPMEQIKRMALDFFYSDDINDVLSDVSDRGMYPGASYDTGIFPAGNPQRPPPGPSAASLKAAEKSQKAASKLQEKARQDASRLQKEADRQREKLKREMENLGQEFVSLTEDMDPYLKVQNELHARLELINKTYAQQQAGLLDVGLTYERVAELQAQAIELADQEEQAITANTDAAKEAAGAKAALLEASQQQTQDALEKNKALADEFGGAVAEAFGSFVLGQQDASNAMADVLEQLAQMILRLTVLKPLAEAVSNSLAGKDGSGGFFSSALGSAVSGFFGGGVTKLAKGGVTATGLPHGVYSAPTAFPINGPSRGFSRGTGLLGEGGSPEAIMPLKRGSDGKLGVSGGGNNVYINNYAGVDVKAREMDHGTVIDIVRATVTNDLTRGGTPMSQGVMAAMKRERGRR